MVAADRSGHRRQDGADRLARARGVLNRHLVRRAVHATHRVDASSRAVPDLLIIGAQKSGTTSLFEDLSRDPRLVPSLRKEVHYFDRNAVQPVSWYRAFFPRRRMLTRRNLLTGEATPYYLFHPYAPARARAVVPDARLLVLLREPVERAFSHWRHNRRRGREDLEFAAAVDAEPDRLAGEVERLADPAYVSEAHQRYSYVSRGHYAEQLERWWQHYPREQMLVVATELLFGPDHERVRRRIRAFVGLDASGSLPPLPAANLSAKAEVADGDRARLEEVFRDGNRRLAALLGDDAPPWAGY